MADDFALFDVDGKGHITPGDLDAVGVFIFHFCKCLKSRKTNDQRNDLNPTGTEEDK